MKHMAVFLIIPCVAFLAGCATTEYYTNPQSAGYSDQVWGGLCENCNRMFTYSSAQFYGTERNNMRGVDPAEWGLKKDMTQQDVINILGKPIRVENDNPISASYLGEIWYWPGRKVIFTKHTNNADNFKLYCCISLEQTGIRAIDNITCPYCGRVQDIKMAANRWTYAVQQQQVYNNQQAMGQALQGMSNVMQAQREGAHRRTQIILDHMNQNKRQPGDSPLNPIYTKKADSY